MKPEHIEKIIDGMKMLGAMAISAVGFVLSVNTIAKEMAFGRAAVRKLKEEYAAIKKEFDELRKDQIDLSEEVRDVQSKYEKLIERMLNNFPFKQ